MTDPEIELVRRGWFLAVPALLLAATAGGVISGRAAAASAAIGVALVFVNLAVQGLTLAWAARISFVALAAVALGGFVIRLAVIFLVLVALNRLAWFSPLAFAICVIPCTLALLAYEMRQLSGRMQSELWTFEDQRA